MVEGSSPGSRGPKGVQLGWDLDRQMRGGGGEGRVWEQKDTHSLTAYIHQDLLRSAKTLHT